MVTLWAAVIVSTESAARVRVVSSSRFLRLGLQGISRVRPHRRLTVAPPKARFRLHPRTGSAGPLGID